MLDLGIIAIVTLGVGNLFFQLVNAGCEHGAMILTSIRSFAEWGEVFVPSSGSTLMHHDD